MSKPLNIVILDHQGNIIAVNDAWQNFAADNSNDPNITKKTGIGINYLEVCRMAKGNNSAEAKAVVKGITDVLAGKVKFFSLEYPCHSPFEERWFSLNCTPLLSSQMRAVISHSDITDKKTLHKNLIDSEENYHQLFSENPFPMWVYDVETLHFLEVNQAAVDHYGYSREEFLSLTIKDIRPKEDIPKLLKTISTSKEKTRKTGIWDHLKKDGTIMKVEVNSHVLNFEGVLARLVIINDVTERLQTDEKLKLKEARYRMMFENNPFPMIIYNYETLKFLEVNEATCLHYGYTRDEFVNMKLTDICSPKDLENIKGLVEKNDDGRTIYGAWKHKKKDGTEIFVETTSHKLQIAGDRSRIVLINDVTEKMKAEEDLRKSEAKFLQSQKMEAVGRLAGGIAHDFNNMLTVIKGYSDLILRLVPKENPLHKYVSEIKEAGERSTSLTSQLLAFSRTQVLRPEILNLNKFISKTITMLKMIIGEDIQIDLELDSVIGNVKADPGQLTQVLMNLLVNARDAMPNGGKITIRTDQVFIGKDDCLPELDKKAGNFIRVEVRDTGIGMDKKTLQHIFDPFFTTKEIGKGTGLGLSTVYGIIKQSGGCISVKSKFKKGTSFEIYLPFVTEQISNNEGNESPHLLPVGKGKILIVEDEKILRRLTRSALEESGYQVLEAKNGSEAIKLFKKENPKIDLVMTDVVMPGMSGFELYKNLTQFIPNLPKFLFTSGYLEDERINNVSFDISQNFIAKPFRLDALIQKIQEILSFESVQAQ